MADDEGAISANDLDADIRQRYQRAIQFRDPDEVAQLIIDRVHLYSSNLQKKKFVRLRCIEAVILELTMVR